MSDPLPVDTAITIRAETLFADRDACKFTVSRVVHPGGPFFFNNKERASGSPLIERLFALPGVAHVLVTDDVVTVGKEPSAEWSRLKAAIGTAIRTQLLSPVPAILETPESISTRARSDSEVRAVVQELLDRELNRSIALHGGKISIVDLRDGKLSITMTRLPRMRGLCGDAATGTRGYGEKRRAGNRGDHRHDGPLDGKEAVLRAHDCAERARHGIYGSRSRLDR